MNRMLRLALVSGFALFAASVAAAQDSLASARQLYGSAAYDEALSMLDRIKSTTAVAAGESRAVDQYRAFCLMALGRQSDAVRAVEAAVLSDPFYLPSEDEVSPRVLGAFRDARRRLLPAVTQERYQSAKTAYDRKDYGTALQGFEATLRLMTAPDLAEAAGQPPLSDLRTLAAGFRDLARAAAAPPAPKAEPKPAAPAPAPLPPPKPFYTMDDAGVVPPVVISQRVPRWPNSGIPNFVPRARLAVLEVLINEQGRVDSASVKPSITPVYDEMLTTDAKAWRYRPATKDNLPVKFKKAIQINVQ